MPVNIDHSTAGTTTLAAPSSGTTTLTLPSTTGTIVGTDSNSNATITGTYVMGSSFLRNRLINGNMYVAQRNTSATVTAGTTVPTASTGYPCVDRWFVYSTGANVTAAQVAGSGSNRNLLQITGAASVTAVGIGQRIENLNSYDLAGQTCTLSVSIANSVLTTVTWTASYATTANTFGTIGTPTKTQIATGTFTVNSTLTQYTTSISVPAAATTGIEILFTVGAQTSGTWQIGNVQFEAGSIATPFERQPYTAQVQQCQRYYQKTFDASVTPANNTGSNTGAIAGHWAFGNTTYVRGTFSASGQWFYATQMRATPTITLYTYNSATAGQWSNYLGTVSASTRIESIGVNSSHIDDNGVANAWGTGQPFVHATASAEL